MMAATRILMTLAVCGLFAGCAASQPLGAVEVFAGSTCQRADEGLRQVTLEQVAALRGSRLLPTPGDGSSDTQATLPDSADGMTLIAISKGTQPTPGYGFRLQGASIASSIATVELDWQVPAPDAVLAQVTTHPCIVVGLDPGDYDRVRAVEVGGGEIGILTLD